MPCDYLPFSYTQAFSYSFPVQTVCACYVHSPWLLVWVVIMLHDDLIHLFVEDEILQCRLQDSNVTSLLTELTFTQMLKLNCGTSYLIFNNLCGWYTSIKWPTSHFLVKNVMNSWGPNIVGGVTNWTIISFSIILYREKKLCKCLKMRHEENKLYCGVQ